MRVALVTNTDNGKGLQRDVELITPILQTRGCTVTPVHFQHGCTPSRGTFDLAIFLEVAPDRFFDCASRRWLIPNPEWWVCSDSISGFEHVLCKTEDAFRIFSRRGDARPGQVVYTSFTTRRRGANAHSFDVLGPVLHVAGGSILKGTQAILDAWGSKEQRPLTVVTSEPQAFRWPSNGQIRRLVSVPDEQLEDELLQHPVHLQPSEYEGWGHCLHESLAKGAVVVTTDAAPMNEWGGVLPLVPVVHMEMREGAQRAKVDARGIKEALSTLGGFLPHEIQSLSQQAKRGAEDRAAFFEHALTHLLQRTTS